ncbi:MAG: c-di-GMP phosphodiesterase, partial [Spirochaetia bacterium]|nr:c-di-GMP phosphodiesterase [Spirochaetia bacterium]
GVLSNNYPELKSLLSKLQTLEDKYKENPQHHVIARDIKDQILSLKQDLPYDEDANILAIASEFASLTSDVPWRGAFTAERAVRMIINNSYFTYPARAVREFLDHAAISLCDNQKILNEGDYIVIAARSADGKMYFEVAKITRSDRY